MAKEISLSNLSQPILEEGQSEVSPVIDKKADVLSIAGKVYCASEQSPETSLAVNQFVASAPQIPERPKQIPLNSAVPLSTLNADRTITTSQIVTKIVDILSPCAHQLLELKLFFKLGGQEQELNDILSNTNYVSTDNIRTLKALLLKILKWKEGNPRGATKPLTFGKLHKVLAGLDIKNKQSILDAIVKLSAEGEGSPVPPKVPPKL